MLSQDHFQANKFKHFSFFGHVESPPPPLAQHGLLAQLNMACNSVTLGVNRALFRRSLLVVTKFTTVSIWICETEKTCL